jgi:hypothetical protein
MEGFWTLGFGFIGILIFGVILLSCRYSEKGGRVYVIDLKTGRECSLETYLKEEVDY